jgi:hypothetical protein
MSTKLRAQARTRVADNPLEGEQLLLDALFGERQAPMRPRAADTPKPQHYKIVSISLYLEDIQRLEQLVADLKKRGHYKANKSQVIREALLQLELDKVPPQR